MNTNSRLDPATLADLLQKRKAKSDQDIADLQLMKQSKVEIMQKWGLRFWYRHPGNIGVLGTNDDFQTVSLVASDHHRVGMVVAYRPIAVPHDSKHPLDVYEISTAVCAPTDVYNKAIGAFIAAKNFDEERRILVRKPSQMTFPEYLKGMFDL